MHQRVWFGLGGRGLGCGFGGLGCRVWRVGFGGESLNGMCVRAVEGRWWVVTTCAMQGFEAVDAFAKANGGAMPMPANKEHAAQVVALAKEINSKAGNLVSEVDEKLISLLASNARGDLSPMAAVLGGVVGQEVLKACSGKFMPLSQWLVYDCTECLPDGDLPASEFELTGSRYDGQIAVFGKSFQAQLESLNYFLVGAGAIGCEMLKNWAMMGLGCGPQGCVHLTDMDTIEKSNLNRQFLFRTTDIQKLKSTTAAEAVTKMNKNFNVKCYQTRVGPDSEEVLLHPFLTPSSFPVPPHPILSYLPESVPMQSDPSQANLTPGRACTGLRRRLLRKAQRCVQRARQRAGASLHGPALYLLPETTPGKRHAWHQGQRAGALLPKP